jgi:uroporphyrinogen III methyltransferase/synthase
MLADAGPRLATKAAPAPDSVPKKSDRKDPASAAAATAAVPAGLWPRLRRWLADEFGDLVQVRTVAVPEAMLLSVDQQYFVRQQLKLRLLNAREALLAHNDRLFRADINEALSVLARFFDNHQATVAAALAQLKQLAVAMPAVNVPTVTESLAALHALRPISPPPH